MQNRLRIIISWFFPAQFSSLGSAWLQAWNDRPFRQKLTGALLALSILALFIPRFFSHIQEVPGYRINDPVLNALTPRDMSLFIFMLIYSVILLAVINISVQPRLLLRFLQAYTLLTVIRIGCIYFIPLEPEYAIIPLQDPFVGHFFYDGKPITKDLFFSGHVSIMALLTFIIPYRSLKYLFGAATILVAFFILMQHVHYTVDLLAAPLVAWLCYAQSGKSRVNRSSGAV